MRSVLTPDGVVMIKTPNACSLQRVLTRSVGSIHRSDYANPLHVVWHGRASLTALVEQCGYHATKQWFIQGCRT